MQFQYYIVCCVTTARSLAHVSQLGAGETAQKPHIHLRSLIVYSHK